MKENGKEPALLHQERRGKNIGQDGPSAGENSERSFGQEINKYMRSKREKKVQKRGKGDNFCPRPGGK